MSEIYKSKFERISSVKSKMEKSVSDVILCVFGCVRECSNMTEHAERYLIQGCRIGGTCLLISSDTHPSELFTHFCTEVILFIRKQEKPLSAFSPPPLCLYGPHPHLL